MSLNRRKIGFNFLALLLQIHVIIKQTGDEMCNFRDTDRRKSMFIFIQILFLFLLYFVLRFTVVQNHEMNSLRQFDDAYKKKKDE